MEDLIEAYLSVYEDSDIAKRAKDAVEHQRKGTHGDDHEMEKESEESTKAVKKATKYKGPKVTPSLPESYDIVLEYLMNEGFADTEQNAITIMANMSEAWIDEILDEAKVDAGLSDDEKRTARSERGTVGYMHPLTRRDKKKKGGKDSSSTGIHGKYFQMQHNKRENQKERDADVQRERDRGAMSRGTWDRD